MRRIARLAQSVERPRDAAVAVVGVLERDGAGDGLVRVVAGPHRLDHLPGRHHAGLGVEGTDLDAAHRGCAGGLVVEGVRVGVGDELLAPLRVDGDPDQVAHRAARYEGRGLLAHSVCCHLHQLVGGGVVSEDVVAEGSRGHRLAHLLTGHRHGVRAEVDDCHPINLTGHMRGLPSNQGIASDLVGIT